MHACISPTLFSLRPPTLLAKRVALNLMPSRRRSMMTLVLMLMLLDMLSSAEFVAVVHVTSRLMVGSLCCVHATRLRHALHPIHGFAHGTQQVLQAV